MSDFKNFIANEESCLGYALSGLGSALCELLDEAQGTLWDLTPPKVKRHGEIIHPPYDPEETPKKLPDFGQKSCPVTPLSGYAQHIKAIQAFAFANPENFAQVMMFSPLSANAPFPKHWDNFITLMAIVRFGFPDRIDDADEFREIISKFDDKYHALGHTINGFKIDTVIQIWNNRKKLFQELRKLASRGDDRQLITKMSGIIGVQPVKAGFMAQLLFGRAGCIDTHNIDIYSTVFPELSPDLDMKKWTATPAQIAKFGKTGEIPKGVDDYVKMLEKLKDRGIGTKQLWDIWVSFVEKFYQAISEHGLGSYQDMGTALDPDDPLYARLRQAGPIPKTLTAGRTSKQAKKGDRLIHVPVGEPGGLGASATHLMDLPSSMHAQHYDMYRQGIPGGAAASAVPFRRLKMPPKMRGDEPEIEPLERPVGMGLEPSSLHYFGREGERELDPDFVRYEIERRMKGASRKEKEKAVKVAQKAAREEKKRRKAAADAAQGSFF